MSQANFGTIPLIGRISRISNPVIFIKKLFVFLGRSAALVCVDCVSVVEAVLKLRAQIAEYAMLIK